MTYIHIFQELANNAVFMTVTVTFCRNHENVVSCGSTQLYHTCPSLPSVETAGVTGQECPRDLGKFV